MLYVEMRNIYKCQFIFQFNVADIFEFSKIKCPTYIVVMEYDAPRINFFLNTECQPNKLIRKRCDDVLLDKFYDFLCFFASY